MCDRFPRKFDVQTSCGPSNYVLGLIFVVNIKLPRTIQPITDSAFDIRTLLFEHVLVYPNERKTEKIVQKMIYVPKNNKDNENLKIQKKLKTLK